MKIKDIKRGDVFYERDMGMVSLPMVATSDAYATNGGHEVFAVPAQGEGGRPVRFFAADEAGPYAPRLYAPGEYPNMPEVPAEDVEAALASLDSP